MLQFVSVAFALNVDPVVDEVLVATDLPWAATAVGAPSLEWYQGSFTLLFEAQVEEPGCTEAYVIGRATSTDGEQWAVDPAPLAGISSRAPCGVRRPAAATLQDGRTFATFELVHDGAVAVALLGQGRPRVRRTTGLEGLQSVSIARRDGLWSAIAVDPLRGLVSLQSTNVVDWVEVAEPLRHGETWWSAMGTRSPALSCYDGSSGLMPWVMHYGGFTQDQVGLTWGRSPDLGLWFYDLAVTVWDQEHGWQAWDSVMTASEAWAVYEADGALHWAKTAGSALPVSPATRDCSSTR